MSHVEEVEVEEVVEVEVVVEVVGGVTPLLVAMTLLDRLIV